jgi:hypothetical protein
MDKPTDRRLTQAATLSTCIILFFLFGLTVAQEILFRPLSNQVSIVNIDGLYQSQNPASTVPDRTIMLSNPSALPTYLIPSKMTIDSFNNLSGVEFASVSNSVSSSQTSYNGVVETSGLVVIDPTYNYGYMLPAVQPVDQSYVLISTNTSSAEWQGQNIPHFSTLSWLPLAQLSNYASIQWNSNTQVANINRCAVTYNHTYAQTVVVGTAITVGPGTGGDPALYFYCQTPGLYRITFSGYGTLTAYQGLTVYVGLVLGNSSIGQTYNPAETAPFNYYNAYFSITGMALDGNSFDSAPANCTFDTTFTSTGSGQAAMIAIGSGPSFGSSFLNWYNVTCTLLVPS